MAQCELCGKNPVVYQAEIEGTVMSVCSDCSRFGKVKGRTNVKIIVQKKERIEVKEPEYVFVPGFGAIVKRAREKAGLTQEEMAKKLNERESTLHNIESEHFKPGVELARKLERTLHIHILDEVKDDAESGVKASRSDGSLTLGDFIKKR